MNGLLGAYNLISNITQSVAVCSTDRFSSIALNLCNRSNDEACFIDVAVTATENTIDNNSRYLEFNTTVAPNTSFKRDGILLSQGEYLTVRYRSEEARCLSATVWGIQSGNDAGIAPITLALDSAPVIATTSLPEAEQGLSYSQQISATGNREITDYSITEGSLPTGLSLNNTTGEISGAASGTDQDYTFTVTVTDSTDNSTSTQLTITKTPDTSGPVFNNLKIGSVFRELEFGTYTFDVTDPSTPVSFAVTSGSLPRGLTLSSQGVLSGTPPLATADSYSITVTATDSIGNSTAQQFDFAVGLPSYQTVNFIGVGGNLSVTGNNSDRVSIAKVSGANSWNNEARTDQIYFAPVTVEFDTQASVGDNGASYKMFGWNTDPTTDVSYSSIDHASFPYRQDTYVVYDNNVAINTIPWDQSQKFYLVYTDTGLIQHWNGDVKLYEAAYNPGLVALDSSFYSPNSFWSAINNIRIRPAMWNGSTYIASSVTSGTGNSASDPVLNTYRFSGTAGETYWIQPPGAASPFQAEYSGDDYRGTGLGYFNWWKSAYNSAPTVNFYGQGYQWNNMLIEQENSENWADIGFSELQTFDLRTATATGTWGTRRGFRVYFGQAGGHGIYNTSQNVCNWGNSTGSIGAGFDGSTCGSFPDGLIMGTGTGSSTYSNRSGVWNFWFAFS